MAEPATDIGRVFKGKYRIERKLGSGAFGSVFAAVQLGLDKPVAVKLLSPDAFKTPGAAERFEREALLASKISHPVMAQILDFGVDEATPFLVMELVEGDDLSAVLEQDGALKPSRAVAVLRQLASLLAEVHACGIVHRDLKPANMKLLRYSKAARQIHVKVLDFGIAKDIASDAVQRLTATGSFVGTPRYMSPEQVRGHDVDARSDLYSCGVIFYELLTGDAPFRAGSVIELIARVLSDPPPVLPARFPAVVRDTVARLLEKDRNLRFADAHALDLALEECEIACRGMDLAETQRSGEHSDALAETMHSGRESQPPTPSATTGQGTRPATGQGTAARPATGQGTRPPTGQGLAPTIAAPQRPATDQGLAPTIAASERPATLQGQAPHPGRGRLYLMMAVTLVACSAAVAAIFIALRRPPPARPAPIAEAPPTRPPEVPTPPALPVVATPDAAVASPLPVPVPGKPSRSLAKGAPDGEAANPAPPSENLVPRCRGAVEDAQGLLTDAAFGKARAAARRFLSSPDAAGDNCPLQRMEMRAVECRALCQGGKPTEYMTCLHALQHESKRSGANPRDAATLTLEVQQVCDSYFKP